MDINHTISKQEDLFPYLLFFLANLFLDLFLGKLSQKGNDFELAAKLI